MLATVVLSRCVDKKVATSMNPLSAYTFFTALLLFVRLLITKGQSQQQATLFMIDASAAPESNSSLQYHLCGLGTRELVSHTTLQLSGGVHHLHEGSFCLLQNLENFTIQGQQTHPKTVIYCQSETDMRRGIAFFNISSLHLSHFDIVNCGREIPSGLPGHVNNTFAYLGPLQKAVLIVTHSTNITIEYVSVDRCLGFAFFLINPQGKTSIEEFSVLATTSLGLLECKEALKRSDMMCSGSGLVVIFSDTNITEQVVDVTDNYKAFLSITKCSFNNNTNWIPVNRLIQLFTSLRVAFETRRILMTGGLSIVVYTGQKGYLVDVKVSDTSILLNTGNIANFGILHYNTIQTCRAQLERLVVSENRVLGVRETSSGAGLFIALILFFDSLNSVAQYQGDIYDVVEIYHSNFTRNSAITGGALRFYMTPQNVSNVRLLVRDTTFTSNIASIGSALYAFQFQSPVNSKGIYIYMEDITVSYNTFPRTNVLDNYRQNSGVFLVSYGSNISLVGTERKGCFFYKNDVSVFNVVRTNLILRGLISFEDNHGFRGGALSLLDNSVLFIHNGSRIAFARNTAFREGGAIYSNTLGSSVSITCAIQFFADKRLSITHEDLQILDISIVFSNNSALIAGNSIFASPLYHCLFIPSSSIIHTYITDVQQAFLYSEVLYFKETVGNKLSELNSVEEFVCICSGTTFAKVHCAKFHYVLEHLIIPGSTFVLFLNTVDIVGTPVASLLYSYTQPPSSSDCVQLGVNQQIRQIPGLTDCTSVDFTIFAPENATVFIDLSATIGGQKVTVEINTAFCPPGFVLGSSDTSTRLQCLCSEFIKTKLESTCNASNYTIARPTNFWVGTKTLDRSSQIIQFVSTCPINYCTNSVTEIDLRVPDQLCMEGRTGTLCGSCREGLSSVFGTAECRKCSNAWLAFLLLFALIGVLMVISAFLLDLTITHGLINGLFFYSNIVMVNANIFFMGNQGGFLFWFLSWVNLDIGFPLCFYDGMTGSAKAGLQYVFPMYIILMIAFIITISQNSLRIRRLISQLDGIHVLATMLYITFLKLFRTVIDTFTFVTIVSEGKKDSIVWLFDGTNEVNDPISIFLILLGSITMASFLLPYVVFFTVSNYIQRCFNSTRLNAYVDATVAPYKDKLRFWFGARLILTCIIYTIIANRGTNNPTFSLTLELSFLVGFTTIQAYIHPFKSTVVALLDLSFLLNLIALTLGVLFTIQNEDRFHDQDVLVAFSLSVTFITSVGIILWHLLRKLYNKKSVSDKVMGLANSLIHALKGNKVVKMLAKRQKQRDNGPGNEGAIGMSDDGDKYSTGRSDLVTTSPIQTTTMGLQDMIAAPDDGQPQQPSSLQLREPVLEFLDKTGHIA